MFDGLYISKNKALCEEYLGKYPVIFLSLKSVDGLTFEDAKYRMTELIGLEAERFGFLEDSEHLSENEKKRYKAIISLNNGMNTMNEKMLISSLQVLSQLLYKHFGNTDIYCPWDVIQYCKSLYLDAAAKPQDFWSNSSGNAIVRRFIDKADISTKNEIECLIAGESIEKDVVPELTYDELDKSIENLWSVLFTTGYLTHNGHTESGKYRLVIPNREVRNLFVKKIREWFSDVSRNDGKTLEEFCGAFVDKDSKKIEQIFGDYLWNTISIRDTAVAKLKQDGMKNFIIADLRLFL